MNIAEIVRKWVAALNAWFEKAERENQEYLDEIAHPPDSSPDDKLKSGNAGPTLYLDPSDIQPAAKNGRQTRKNLPPPPKSPPPPRDPQTPGQFVVAGGVNIPMPPPGGPPKVAGLSQRRSGERMVSDKVVQNEFNDTVYNQRNEVVAQVHERYAKYGSSVAAAVLSKSLLPNGLEMLLIKLGLSSLGDILDDHDQIVEYIESHGLDDFCQKVGIRSPSDTAHRKHAAAIPPPPPDPPSSGVRARMRMSPSPRHNQGSSKSIDTKGIRIDPVALRPPSDLG